MSVSCRPPSAPAPLGPADSEGLLQGSAGHGLELEVLAIVQQQMREPHYPALTWAAPYRPVTRSSDQHRPCWNYMVRRGFLRCAYVSNNEVAMGTFGTGPFSNDGALDLCSTALRVGPLISAAKSWNGSSSGSGTVPTCWDRSSFPTRSSRRPRSWQPPCPAVTACGRTWSIGLRGRRDPASYAGW